jgi:Tripartite ATP-independent periplasmic transporters, DctQ component.
MKFIEHAIERLTIIFGSAVLVMMVLQIVVDVSMRTFADKGLTATSELVSHYYMVMVSFLPVAYSELRRRHVEATIFTDYLNLKND